MTFIDDSTLSTKTPAGIPVLIWNTGREYTTHGQRIIAREAGGGVIFVDYDRMVDGFLPHFPLARWKIMTGYDKGLYEPVPQELRPKLLEIMPKDCGTVNFNISELFR